MPSCSGILDRLANEMLRKTEENSRSGPTSFENLGDRYGAELPKLDRAIIATITYRDLFDFPVTVREIHRYLQGIHCDYDEVRFALQNRDFVEGYLASDGEYFALKHREALFELRRTRESDAERLWSKALAHGATLASYAAAIYRVGERPRSDAGICRSGMRR